MNIAVLGAGVMGRLTERVAAESGIGVAGVVEPLEGGRLENLGQKTHVVIDFSHPDNIRRSLRILRGTWRQGGHRLHWAQRGAKRKDKKACGKLRRRHVGKLFLRLKRLAESCGAGCGIARRRLRHGAVRNAPQTQDGRAERHRASALGGFEGSSAKERFSTGEDADRDGKTR